MDHKEMAAADIAKENSAGLGDGSSGSSRQQEGDLPVSEAYVQKSIAESSSGSGILPNGNLTAVADERQRGAAVASPGKVAEKMFRLEGYSRSEVASLLAGRGEDSVRLGTAFMDRFSFSDVSLVDGLRLLLKHVTIGGETQEQDRILHHFAKRFAETTSKPLGSLEAVHTLTASVMLLNQDLHGENLGKRMTQSQFIANLAGLCDGSDFAKLTLKEVYNQVKSKQLMFASEEEARNKNPAMTTPVEHSPSPTTIGKVTLPDTFVEIDLDDYPTIFRCGLLKRKDVQGRFGHRHWSLRWCVVRGFLLYMLKPSSNGREPTAVNYADLRNALVLTHAVARPATNYRKRPFVMEICTGDQHSVLFQTSGFEDLQSWALAVNCAAATYSAPPLPSPAGSSARFQRPQLPKHPTNQGQDEQLESHKTKVNELSEQVSEGQDDGEKITDKRQLGVWAQRLAYISGELVRYQLYVDALTLSHDYDPAPAAYSAAQLASPTLSLRSVKTTSRSSSLTSIHSSVSSYHLPPAVGSSLSYRTPSPASEGSSQSQPLQGAKEDLQRQTPSRSSYRRAVEKKPRTSESGIEVEYV